MRAEIALMAHDVAMNTAFERYFISGRLVGDSQSWQSDPFNSCHNALKIVRICFTKLCQGLQKLL